MTNKKFLTADKLCLVTGTALLAALSGCLNDGSSQRSGYQRGPAVQVRAVAVFQDDYDYYPGYETYYSRNRHEYVYHDGSAWVRRPEPQGVTVNVLAVAPSVRLDFHDTPEQHHSTVVQTYPRNWVPPGQRHEDKNERKDEKKKDKKDGDKRDDDKKNDDKRN